LGIGTNSLSSALHISCTSTNENIYADRFDSSAVVAPVVILRKARGTQASPSAILSGDTIGVFGFRGYGATSFSSGSRAGIGALASENWTDSANGSLFGFFTTANGSTTFTYKMQLFGNGNLILQNGGTFTDAGFRLDVNGTARVQGALTLTVPSVAATRETLMIASVSDSLTDKFIISNGTAANSTFAPNFAGYVDTSSILWSLGFTGLLSSGIDSSDSSNFGIIRFNALRTTSSSDPLNGTLSAVENRKLVTFENGSTAYLTFYKNLQVYADGYNISFNTSTGTKIGTATSQKLSLWNATPNVQPTTAITAGAFVANTSGITDDTATFDGYTIGQVVAALRRIGALA